MHGYNPVVACFEHAPNLPHSHLRKYRNLFPSKKSSRCSQVFKIAILALRCADAVVLAQLKTARTALCAYARHTPMFLGDCSYHLHLRTGFGQMCTPAPCVQVRGGRYWADPDLASGACIDPARAFIRPRGPHPQEPELRMRVGVSICRIMS